MANKSNDNHAGSSSAKRTRSLLPPALVETAAGLTAGVAATFAVHPLDMVKTRMQVYQTASSTTTSAGRASASMPPPTTLSVIRALVRNAAVTGSGGGKIGIPTREASKLARLYRGLTPNLLGNASSWASFFLLKSAFERGLAAAQRPRSDHQKQGNYRNDADVLTPGHYFLASLCAGAATQLLTNPIWVLKTRMLATDAADPGAYASARSGFVRLWREEGPGGFYRGLGVAMLAVSHGAVQFAVYEPGKKMYFEFTKRRRTRSKTAGAGHDGDHGDETERKSEMDREREKITPLATVLLSTAAKTVAGSATYPLQVVRSRLQTHDAEAKYGRGVADVVVRLWRDQGVPGFYRGLWPSVVRMLPSTWITFLVYENVKFALGGLLAFGGEV